MTQLVNGNIFTVETDMIVQQCNCLTKYPHGLSKSIKDELKVDPYGHRRVIPGRWNCAIEKDRDQPGTIKVYRKGKKYVGQNKRAALVRTQIYVGQNERAQLVRTQIYVACLFAQFSPGKPGVYHRDLLTADIRDTKEQRLVWFKQCLEELTEMIEQLKTGNKTFRVAFPYLIGCGLGGGDWKQYSKAIEEWAATLKDVDVMIVRLV